jgi:protein TonB
MFLDKYKYPFLARMIRPEGLPPKFVRPDRITLGAPRRVVFEIALCCSLLLVLAAFRFFPTLPRPKPILPSTQEVVSIEDVEITRQIERPPAPPRPPIPIEAPPDEVLADATITSTELDPSAILPQPQSKQEEDEEEYFVAVEEMPRIIGGIQELMRHVVYPELAVRAGIQGRVYVLAYVNERGDVDKVELMRGIGGGCDEAALAAVKKVKFIPGKQRGKPIKTRIAIPIDFVLTP